LRSRRPAEFPEFHKGALRRTHVKAAFRGSALYRECDFDDAEVVG
jgi:hypothetical protein